MYSAFSQNYQYPEQAQLFLSTNYNYHHHDDQRSKTPSSSSLTNNPRHSPGPLSTPPGSRNTSQPPPDQPPDQMIYDDVGGSQSDSSPASVATPDHDAFEFEMLDHEVAGTSYQNNQATTMSPTHLHQNTMAALDSTNYFSDEALRAAYNAAQAADQAQQYHASMSMAGQNFQAPHYSQPYNQPYSQNFTDHPPHHDPWTSHRPPQNPNVPRSGDVVFDLESDSMDYTPYVNMDVNNWTNNNTDPNYLISPSEPVPPPLDNFMGFTSHNHQMHQHQRPLEMRLTVPSPPMASQGFINYNQSSTYFNEAHFPPSSPDTSTISSSFGQIPQSPLHVSQSPQASLPSPGGSDAIYSSYQNSDHGMMVDSYMGEQSDAKPFTSVAPSQLRISSVHVEASPTRSIPPEMSFNASPEPEHHMSRGHSSSKGNRPGGRALGTHLEPKVAKAAHDMRKITACWHCVLQRDKCGPGEICVRCEKRSQRPNADCGLGCSRVKLVELADSFLPSLVAALHEDNHLTQFVTKHIRSWMNSEITIYVTCGQYHMPRLAVKVYEFIPNGNELLVQYQYRTDPKTHQRYQLKKQSPALGMVHINHNEEKKYDKYISDIVDNHLDAFGELCWMEDDNDFQQKLFKLMTRVQPRGDDEAKLLREVFRLIVCTFIMSHTLTIAEETKHTALSKMHSYEGPQSYVQNFTSPRMTNRQLKYFFNRLQRSIMSTVLNKLQQIFKSSKGCDKWIMAFVAVVGMCMAHEDQQKTIHQVMATLATTERRDPREMQGRADYACREIDQQIGFIMQIFRWKYNRKHNPLRDSSKDWGKEVGFGDEHSVNFVRNVAQLVTDNIDFLQMRQGVSISVDNQGKYTSRLVGRFLTSFWFPSA